MPARRRLPGKTPVMEAGCRSADRVVREFSQLMVQLAAAWRRIMLSCVWLSIKMAENCGFLKLARRLQSRKYNRNQPDTHRETRS
ncbi:hypothetical protein [Sphingomonas sp. Leaf25]|uniref:hypothetical protein n=1 Tax=Sphingomonas sp. Leaf25 TaxID=1735692 RepID=UPI000AC6CEB0|nr:hypothetical protein [Sphingomonas sp. Leaf25]